MLIYTSIPRYVSMAPQRQLHLYLCNGSPVSDTLINFVLSPVAEGNDITAKQMLQRRTYLHISLGDLRKKKTAHLTPLQARESYAQLALPCLLSGQIRLEKMSIKATIV